MSNNMTRKGLAVGAGLGLLASGLVGVAPAQAAETLALAPATGTAYKVLTTSEFELTVGFSGTESAAAVDTVKYMITNASGAQVSLDAIDGGSDAGTTKVEGVGTVGVNVSADTATAQVAYEHGANAIGSQSGLQVAITPASATSVNVGVQAWLDIDGDNAIDSNEPTSPTRTIEFVDHASVSATATLDTAVVGAASLSATVSIPGFNMDQLDSDDVKVEFFKNNVTIASTSDSASSATGTGHDAFGGAVSVALRTNPNLAAWSAADAEMRSTLYPDANDASAADNTVYNLVANAAGAVYSAKVGLKDHAGAWPVIATSVGAATPATGQVSALSAITEANSASTDNSDNVRAGAGSFTAKTTATINAGYAKAGQTVTFKIEEGGANTVSTAASISAGGKTLKNSNIATVQFILVDVLTNALGVASLDVTYTGIVATNTFKISATALNATAAATPAAAITYTAVASDIATAQSNVKAGKLQAVIGQPFSVTWNIVDDFGQVPAGTYRLVLTEDSSSANYAQTINFVNGVATLTQSENSTAANAYTLSADVQQQNLDGTWDASPNGGVAVAADVLIQAYATDPTVKAIAVTASATGIGAAADLALELDDTKVGDSDLQKFSVLTPTLSDVTTLTYTVTSSTGEALVGEPITVSAAGLQFVAESDTWYGVGSLSGTTNASGQFIVKVYSNLAGAHTVTATSGAVSKTQSLVFTQAKDDTGYTLTLSAPAYAGAGSTFKVTATLKDFYGNLVTTDTAGANYIDGATDPTFSMTYTGPGLIVGSLPTKTVNGVAEFSVLLGANDSGSIAVTASYDADGTGTAAAAETASAAVTIGAAPAAPADTKVNAGSFKGYVALYAKGYAGKRMSAKVGNDWVVVPVLASNFERVVEFTGAGYTVAVRIYIDRVLIDTITVTTK